jgi:hypothetical protein
MAVSEGVSTTGVTARTKFIGSLVLLIKSTTPMKMQLLPSTQETTQIHSWLMMMTSVFENQQLLHPLSPSKLL